MTVRRIEVADATESLATYIRKAAGSGPVVVTDDGQPVAALVMLEHTDLETSTGQRWRRRGRRTSRRGPRSRIQGVDSHLERARLLGEPSAV